MPSYYSSSLRAELQAGGENDSTWGDKTNVNIGTILEDAIAGLTTISLSDANYQLSVQYGAADEARRAILVVTGTATVQRDIIVPAVSKVYVVRNVTSGGFGVQIKTQSGQGTVIPNGETQIVFCDGASVIRAAGSTSAGSLTPSALSSAAAAWALYGTVGLNRSEALVSGYGVYAVDGTVGSEFKMYFKGTRVGSFLTKVESGTATATYLDGAGLPIAMSMNGVPAIQVETDGNVDVAKTLTAASLASTGSVIANGNVTAYSDERLKKDWLPLVKSFTKRLAAIKFGTYTRTDTGARQAGVSAQELKKVLPEAVEVDEHGFLSVAYGNAALVAVIQLAKELHKLEDIGLNFLMNAKQVQDEVQAIREELTAMKKGR